jgi:hypothetical protein
MAKATYTTEDAAERLVCTADHVAKLCRKGQLEGELVLGTFRDGRTRWAWRISRASVQQLKREREARARRLARQRR